MPAATSPPPPSRDAEGTTTMAVEEFKELGEQPTNNEVDAMAAQSENNKKQKELEENKPIAGHQEKEGGPLGVRAIVGAGCVYFCVWGVQGSWTVFQNGYEQNQLRDYSSSQIAWIGSVQLCMIYLSTVVAGRLYDSGHLRIILIFSTLLSSFAFMMASISTQYWQYIITQGFLLGTGLGAAFSPAVACVSTYYRKNRGLANGLLSTGSAIGGLVMPIYVSKMIDNPRIGLPWALRTQGFVCLVLYGVAVLLMKQKDLPPNKRPLLDFSVFRQKAYSFTAAGLFFTTLGAFYPIFYIQPLAVSKGVEPGLAFYSIAILNGVGLIGRVAPLIASDKVGALNVLVCCLAALSAIIYGFTGVGSFGGMAAISALNGIAYGCYVTINPVVTANLSDHPTRIGTHIGMAFICNAVAGLVGPVALGAVITATHGYWQGAVIAGTFVAVAAVLIGFANVFQRRRLGTWRV